MNLIFIAPHLDQQHHNQLMSSADVIAIANSITMVTTSCQDAEMPGVRYHEVGVFFVLFFSQLPCDPVTHDELFSFPNLVNLHSP